MKDSPFVSILIPVRNEVRYITRCLQAMADQDYPPERIEILVADGMSDDGTYELLQSWIALAANQFIFKNSGKIVPKGLNILIPKAKGDVVMRVDGHSIIDPDYVSICVRHLQHDLVEGVGGPMR